jgi:rhodanese-related sulfurtransferase
MIRDRLKSAARRAAVKIFNMEFDVQQHVGAGRDSADPSKYDPSIIPKVVDGSGDTPGPNHKEDIGRTWLAAQLVGGVSPMLVDMRPPYEWQAGVLPGALRLTGAQVGRNVALLPDKAVRVTVYDQTGQQGSREMAEWLRGQGWTLARRLRGGFAEWMEHGEPMEKLPRIDAARVQVGDEAKLKDGRAGWVHGVEGGAGALRYALWFKGEDALEVVGEDALS